MRGKLKKIFGSRRFLVTLFCSLGHVNKDDIAQRLIPGASYSGLALIPARHRTKTNKGDRANPILFFTEEGN
jgi:hypothetical protein